MHTIIPTSSVLPDDVYGHDAVHFNYFILLHEIQGWMQTACFFFLEDYALEYWFLNYWSWKGVAH